MIIEKSKCNHCETIHERKIYENKSEAIADIFTEHYFIPIWDKLKEKRETQNFEEFCKELFSTAIYHYHKNRRRIIVAKNSIRTNNRTENKGD